jgi:hypothetical protein
MHHALCVAVRSYWPVSSPNIIRGQRPLPHAIMKTMPSLVIRFLLSKSLLHTPIPTLFPDLLPMLLAPSHQGRWQEPRFKDRAFTHRLHLLPRRIANHSHSFCQTTPNEGHLLSLLACLAYHSCLETSASAASHPMVNDNSLFSFLGSSLTYLRIFYLFKPGIRKTLVLVFCPLRPPITRS